VEAGTGGLFDCMCVFFGGVGGCLRGPGALVEILLPVFCLWSGTRLVSSRPDLAAPSLSLFAFLCARPRPCRPRDGVFVLRNLWTRQGGVRGVPELRAGGRVPRGLVSAIAFCCRWWWRWWKWWCWWWCRCRCRSQRMLVPPSAGFWFFGRGVTYVLLWPQPRDSARNQPINPHRVVGVRLGVAVRSSVSGMPRTRRCSTAGRRVAFSRGTSRSPRGRGLAGRRRSHCTRSVDARVCCFPPEVVGTACRRRHARRKLLLSADVRWCATPGVSASGQSAGRRGR